MDMHLKVQRIYDNQQKKYFKTSKVLKRGFKRQIVTHTEDDKKEKEHHKEIDVLRDQETEQYKRVRPTSKYNYNEAQ